jgi:hypothetical protein
MWSEAAIKAALRVCYQTKNNNVAKLIMYDLKVFNFNTFSLKTFLFSCFLLSSSAFAALSETTDYVGAHHVLDDLPAGYVQDATVDYTDIIQQSIDKYDFVVFPGFPLLINDKGISLHSNQKVAFQSGGKLKLKATDKSSYAMLKLFNIQNVLLLNPSVEGDRNDHLSTGGEWGMGISILGSDNITLINPVTNEGWGDGIYIGEIGDKHYSSNIYISGAKCNHNRRNGLSVISVDGLTVIDSEFTNNVGTAPEAGVDLEPNNAGNELKGPILFKNIKTASNSYGFVIAPLELSRNGSQQKVFDIHLINHEDDNSLYAFATTSLGSTKTVQGLTTGTIEIANPIWKNNKRQPVWMINKSSDGPQVIFRDVQVVNGDITTHMPTGLAW